MFWPIRKNKAPAAPDVPPSDHWHTCLVRCVDGSLFTVVAHDVDETISVINSGRGPQYTRSRVPVFLVYSEEFMNERDAERRADHIRRMNRRAKEVLLSDLVMGALEAS